MWVLNNFGRRELLAGACLFAISAQANAQDVTETETSTASVESEAPANPNEYSVSEIIVTAQKREQRLQDVGLTVSAIGAADLAKQRIQSVEDLAKSVPGLVFTPSPSGTPVYSLRGVGFFETSVAAYPDVTAYLDQAPLPLPAMSALTAFDLARVEVLKGPQGTLFGNNATGGAINFIAAKPTDYFSGGVELGYARFNTIEAQGFVSGPLTETILARVAVKATKGDDWQKSYTRDDTLGSVNRVAGRLLLDWEASDRLNFSLNVNGWRDRSDPQAPQNARQVLPSDLQSPIGSVGLTGEITEDFPILSYPVAPRDPRAADWTPEYRPFADNNLWQTSLTTVFDVTDNIQLTSLTNFVDLHFNTGVDHDGTALASVQFADATADAKTFTQELRLASTGAGDPIRWVLGVNYDRTSVYELGFIVVPDSSNGAQQGFSANTFDSDQKMRNIAGFGNIEFDVSDMLTVKGGVRYTESKRTSVNGSYEAPNYQELPGSPGLTNFINFLWANVYVPVFCPDVTFTPVQFGESVSINPDTCVTGPYKGTLKEDSISWSVGADFKPSDDILLYANIAKGYKAGSFPTVSAATFNQYRPVTQESVVDYEVGFKTQLGAGITFNGAAFYYDYKDKQVRGKLVDPLFGLQDQLVNVPKSVIKGAEAELAYNRDGLSVRLSGMYLDAKIKEYDGIVAATRDEFGLANAVYASFAGVPLPYAPKLQGAAAIDYTFPLNNSLSGFVGGNVSAQTKSYSSSQLSAQNKIDTLMPGYATLDLRAGVTTPDEAWRVMVWGKNVTNRFYLTNHVRVFDNIAQYTGRPAEYGVSVAYKF